MVSGGGDVDVDEDYIPSPPGFDAVAAPGGGPGGVPPRPDYRQPLEAGVRGGGGRDFHYPDEDMDEEDQMMASAIQESMEEAAHHLVANGRGGAQGSVGRRSGAAGAPITIDDDEDNDDDMKRAIRESTLMGRTGSIGGANDGTRRGAGGGSAFDAVAALGLGVGGVDASGAARRRGRSGLGAAEHERDNRPPPARAADLIFGGMERGRLGEQGQMFGASGGVFNTNTPGGPPGVADHDFVELPDDINREEARMLESAMLGIPYEGPVSGVGGGAGLGISGVGIDGGPWVQAVAPSVETTEARMMRSEQDWAYQESLRLDRAKEAAAAVKREAEERAAAEAAVAAAEEAAAAAKAAEERNTAIIAAAATLPDEPAAGGEGVVDVAIRLPDGRRVRRRFARTHPLQAIFSFLVSAEHLEPNTYRLVSQFPRRSFENMADGAPTLEAVGLTQKQEALFVELTTG